MARQHSRALRTIESAVAELLGAEPDKHGDYGHISENIGDADIDTDALLRKMQIAVEKVSKKNDDLVLPKSIQRTS